MRVYIHQFNGVATMNVLPLAAGLVVAAAKMDPVLAGIAEFEIQVDRLPPADVVHSYDRPGVLAFSCYCWNDAFTHEVARQAKARYADAMVVLGGPNVPRRPERIVAFMRSRPYVDVLVLGEGEISFRELLRARLENAPLTDVAGLVVRDSGAPDGIRVTAARDRIRDFSQTASPYLDGTFDALFARHGAQLTAGVCETNRGCPFSCTFCDWGQATQSRVHELPLERVTQEFEWLGARGIPYLYIVDANFGIRPRDIEIVRHLTTVRHRTGVPLYCHFHLTKNAHRRNLATVEALRDAGVGCQVALSMQDFDDEVLAAIKRENISLEQSLRLRKVCNERGIPTYNELILRSCRLRRMPPSAPASSRRSRRIRAIRFISTSVGCSRMRKWLSPPSASGTASRRARAWSAISTVRPTPSTSPSARRSWSGRALCRTSSGGARIGSATW